jgi:hypothetical protein
VLCGAVVVENNDNILEVIDHALLFSTDIVPLFRSGEGAGGVKEYTGKFTSILDVPVDDALQKVLLRKPNGETVEADVSPMIKKLLNLTLSDVTGAAAKFLQVVTHMTGGVGRKGKKRALTDVEKQFAMASRAAAEPSVRTKWKKRSEGQDAYINHLEKQLRTHEDAAASAAALTVGPERATMAMLLGMVTARTALQTMLAKLTSGRVTESNLPALRMCILNADAMYGPEAVPAEAPLAAEPAEAAAAVEVLPEAAAAAVAAVGIVPEPV